MRNCQRMKMDWEGIMTELLKKKIKDNYFLKKFFSPRKKKRERRNSTYLPGLCH